MRDILHDVLEDNLHIVFCGTAASTISAQRGAYYAHPQNKFWRILHETRLTPELLQPLLTERLGPEPSAVLLRANVAADRALLALLVRDLMDRELAVAVLKRRLSWVAERRALFGALGPEASGGLPQNLCRNLLSASASTGISVPAGAVAGAPVG